MHWNNFTMTSARHERLSHSSYILIFYLNLINNIIKVEIFQNRVKQNIAFFSNTFLEIFHIPNFFLGGGYRLRGEEQQVLRVRCAERINSSVVAQSMQGSVIDTS